MSRSHISLAEFHRRQRRGRRIFWALCAVILIVLALCMAACSPALIRIDSPARNFRNAPVYQPPGKVPTSPDQYWSDWLNQRTATRLQQ